MQSQIFAKTVEQNIVYKPLAEILRPQSLDMYEGQKNLVGKDGIIRKLIKEDKIPSMILWGPPGVGKTTLALIISKETNSKFIQISAVSSGKKDLESVIKQAKENAQFLDKKTILFIDEIHRFNKAQQDYLLPFVENGTITLIGATTENPSFEVIAPLLSRTKVFTLDRLDKEDLENIYTRAMEIGSKQSKKNLQIDSDAKEFLLNIANGDPRTLINTLEICFNYAKKDVVTKSEIQKVLGSKVLYDKNGEEHFNIISALHKSMRSSDANASLYWLARMIEAGEDPLYIARRMLRFAAEDVGNSDPQALILANAVFDACHKLGYPECNVHLAQLAVYLAKAPKDNSCYIAIKKAQDDAKNFLNLPVPLHLRNAPTKLMKELGYSKGYIYDHDVEGKISGQACMPDKLKDRKYL
jgi:putative ATPase